jgi:hypothetical protein
MFGFIQNNTPNTKYYFSNYDTDRKNIQYFDGSETWNTILIRNINTHDNNHQEHVVLTMLEKYIGKIRMIKDVYQNRYEKTIAVTFDWWYKNRFTMILSDNMDESTYVSGNKKIYNEIELIYTCGTENVYYSLIEAV